MRNILLLVLMLFTNISFGMGQYSDIDFKITKNDRSIEQWKITNRLTLAPSHYWTIVSELHSKSKTSSQVEPIAEDIIVLTRLNALNKNALSLDLLILDRDRNGYTVNNKHLDLPYKKNLTLTISHPQKTFHLTIKASIPFRG